MQLNYSKSIIIKQLNKRESGAFGETLDKINWMIYNAINLNLNSFTIRFDPEEREQYHGYFENDFTNEYENNYFKFNILENWEDGEIIIRIRKL